MNIYIIGIGGAGLGPMALLLADAGHTVYGSDRQKSLMTQRLEERNISFSTVQDGTYLEQIHLEKAIDWVVYSSAVKTSNLEFKKALSLGIKHTKRHDLINFILESNQQDLIAIAGTHGKTTTTAMMVWTLQQLHIPVSYLIGSNISFGPSAHFEKQSSVFVYEADEFDRNFLHFNPKAAVITSIEYDHPDTYANEDDYFKAFETFMQRPVFMNAAKDCNLQSSVEIDGDITLAGTYNKSNATLVLDMILQLQTEYKWDLTRESILKALLSFPGTERRFERLTKHIYTDYAHTPKELKATISILNDTYPNMRKSLVYQPHQNLRQHLILEKGGYGDVCEGIDVVYWLDTFLSREDDRRVLSAVELADTLDHGNILITELNTVLVDQLTEDYHQGNIIIFCGAGSIDSWARSHSAIIAQEGN